MKHLTIRNVPYELAEALSREKERRGTSLNQTVIDLLSQGLGTKPGEHRRNGLARLAGTWTDDEFDRFEEAVAVTEEIDEELWR
jgi:plasmid stability protein